MSKKEFWVNGDRRVELYSSTYNPGNRNSLAGRHTSTKLRGAHFGVNDFNTREDARAFLTSKGFKKETA